MRCTLTKLDKLKSPIIEDNPWGNEINDVIVGFSPDKPKIGMPFYIVTEDELEGVRTSRVKSFYVHDTNNDKLVLPSDFPDARDLDFSKVNLKSGEMLIATCNSIYMVTDITNKLDNNNDN